MFSIQGKLRLLGFAPPFNEMIFQLRGDCQNGSLASGVAETFWDDPRLGPAPGEAFYYLARVGNACR